MSLPSTYQQVEWIGGSGTQYIDTLYVPTVSPTNFRYTVQFSLNTGALSDNCVIGARTTSTANHGYKLNCCSGVYEYQDIQTSGSKGSVTYDTVTKFDVSVVSGNTKYYLNDAEWVTSSVTGTSSTNNLSIYLLAMNDNGTKQWGLHGKLYFAKLYDQNNLVRDFVPCYRKSDNVIGLYDLVNDVFYENAGTGTFTKGSDVSSGKPIYFNGVQCSKVYFNGTELQGAKFNGNTLF